MFLSFDQCRRLFDRTVKKRRKTAFVVFFIIVCLVYDPRYIIYGSLWKQTQEALTDPYFLTIHCNLGRLGNQMGTYATLYGLARLNRRIAYTQRCNIDSLQAYFDLSVPGIENITPEKEGEYEIAPYLRPQDKHIPRSKNYLTGHEYPSSFTFYHMYRDEILREFQFRDCFVEYAQSLLHSIADSRMVSVFVGVHIRRSDYCTWLKAFRGKEVDEAYVLKAMEHFRKKLRNAVFVVVSDDRKWCRSKLGGIHDVIITEKPNDPAYDLALLANCNHTIITYGTFGFWGAYLAGGETTYYADFLAPNSKYLNFQSPYDTIYLPEWTGISTLSEEFWRDNNNTFHPKPCEEKSWWQFFFERDW